MRRRPALPLVALASVMVLSPAASTATTTQGSDKATATVALRYTVPPSDAQDRTVVLESLGLAPARPATLVDEEGRTVLRAEVEQLSDAACRSAPVRVTGLGDDRWCLRLAGIRAGAEVTGKLSGQAAVVTLKVAARHGLRLPTAVAVLVLLLAAGFVLYTSSLMGERANRLLVKAQRRRPSDVSGLKEWARSAEDYLTWGRIRTLLGWMRERGRQRATKARASLNDAERNISPELPRDCPLRAEARAEADSKAFPATDLVSPRGEILDHPARVLEDKLRAAEELVRDFNARIDVLLSQVPDERKDDAQAKVDQTRASFADISAASIESELSASMNETIKLLRSYIGHGGAVAYMGTGATAGLAEESPAPRERLRAAVDVVAATWPVMVAIVVLMVVATVAALSASYAPKRAFGTGWDYATLAVGVFGSTSVAGIVTAALLWRRTQPQS